MKTKLKFNNGGTIMKKMNLMIMCLIVGLITLVATVRSQTTVDVVITADNCYRFGFGDVNGITSLYTNVINLSSGDIYNSYGPENYNSIPVPTGAYIYIIAWSDEETFQGLIAQFKIGNNLTLTGPILPSTNPQWEVYATGVNFPWGNPPATFNQTAINSEIATANINKGPIATSSVGWVRENAAFNPSGVGVLAFGSNNVYGPTSFCNTPHHWPPDVVSNINPLAQWMWYNPDPANITHPNETGSLGIGCFPANQSREYYIFRLGPLDPFIPHLLVEYYTWDTTNCMGMIRIVPFGGSGQYEYRIFKDGKWSDWGTNDTFGPLPSDTYPIEVRDSNGLTGSITITIAPSPVVTITANNGPPCCPTATVTGGTPFANPPYYTYSWTGPNGFTATTKDPPCPAQTSSGIYENGTYQLIVTDAAGCTDTATILIDCGCEHPCDVWALGGNSKDNGGHVSDIPLGNDYVDIRSNILGINDMNSNGNLIPSPPNLSPLRIFTNSTEKMRILSTGEVGIGIENPSKKLQVHNGAIILTGANSMGGPMIVFGDNTPTTTNPTFLHPNGNWGIEYDPILGGTGGLNFWRPSGSAGGFANNILFLSNNGNVGIGTSNPSYKLGVVGDIHITGTGYSNKNAWISDSLLKQNINNVSNALSTINQLHSKTFDFKVNEFPYLNLPAGNQIGFIAQDIQNVFPNLVENFNYAEEIDTSGNVIISASTFKGLNYIGFIPLAVAGIQELDSIVTQLSTSGLNAFGPLTTNYLTKSTGLNTVGNSQIFDNGIGVGVGTDSIPLGYKAVFNGKVGVIGDVLVKCANSPWPDYVFDSKHTLQPLDELEIYVTTNKHLPGIPSQNEIEQAGGLNLGEMQTKQMEKIEELYKYIIEMNKNVQRLTTENDELKARMKIMENK